VDGEKFQVKKYDLVTGQWQDLTQLLQREVYEGYLGHVGMSYTTTYPDWVAFHIDRLYADDYGRAEREYELAEEAARGLKYSEREIENVAEHKQQAFEMTAIDEGRLKKINQVYFVNVRTGQVREQMMPVQFERSIFNTPGSSVAIGKTRDNIYLLDFNPHGITILETLPIGDMFPDDTVRALRKINNVIAYNGEDLLFETTRGIVKYTLATQQSEYVVDLRHIK